MAADANAEREMKLKEESGAVRNKGSSWGKNKLKKRRFGCFGLVNDDGQSRSVDKKNGDGSIDIVSAGPAENGVLKHDDDDHLPTHLVIMVNGIIGRAENWRFAAKQFLKAYPQDVIVHCSERNTASLTFDGIDLMGERLADEVISVVERYPHLRKISFVGHSLGGLIARYAIALLYGRNYRDRLSEVEGQAEKFKPTEVVGKTNSDGKIAGLEPINFITCATPHLGSRGHKQVPLFCGFHTLELVARQLSWFLGRTGRHLFLIDNDTGKLPLILRMAHDCEGLPFMSALQSFRRHVLYANVQFDQLVGWCTSSLRRENELPKKRYLVRNDRYRHIVNTEAAVNPSLQQPYNLESISKDSTRLKTQEMLEMMLRKLTTISWERIDVKFGGGRQRLLAHSTIQVQTTYIHSAGADVVQHMVDNFVL